ncbi:putative conserved inner membrane protein [plant metagenome]|uniref:Putative conserved inner membrane protein n=1 Tax=plant metagenome TaxID=1297885 RepID=A0A484T5Y2_9ZZZZ
MTLGLWPSEWYVYGAIALLTVCSLITRAGYMLLGDYLPLPDGVRRALRYAPAAALTAIIVPDFLPWHAGTGPSFDVKLVAGLAGIAVFLRTRNAVLVIVAGMTVLWVLRGVLGLFGA